MDSKPKKYGRKIPSDHPALPWLVKHAPETINRYLSGNDGKTAYERVRGRNFRRDIAQFGEVVMHMLPKSLGRDEMGARWRKGIWLGIIDRSGETRIGTELN